MYCVYYVRFFNTFHNIEQPQNKTKKYSIKLMISVKSWIKQIVFP